MSCYDENFGKDNLEKRLNLNIKKLKREGLREYVIHLIKKWQKRFKFYASYRGNFKKIINRLRKSFKKRIDFKRQVNKDEIKKLLEEISIAKQTLKKELDS